MKKIFIIMFSALFASSTGIFATVGLGTKFGTIVLEKLEPGTVYNITRLRNLPLVVINSGDSEADVIVEVEIPKAAELKEGYEPISDPSWIRITPDKFKLKAKEEIRCEVIVSIPPDAEIGKHYQFKIWSHTIGEDAFGAGVVNRMFFSVGSPGPESLRKAKMKQAIFSAEMDISPDKIYVNVPMGKKVRFIKDLQSAITLVNKGNVDVELKLQSVENTINLPLSEYYVMSPDIKLLTFSKEQIKVKKRSLKDLDMNIFIPKEEKYKDAKLMFVLRATPVKPELPMEFYSRIFVKVVD